MWRAWAFAVLAGLTPLPALALSCAEYSIRDSYWYRDAQAASYVLVLGSLSDLVRTSATGPNGAEVWTARFQGHKASTRAFDQPFEAEVRLVFPDFSLIGGGYDTAAAAEWLPGQTGLIWLKLTDGGHELTAELCQPLVDTDPASIKPALNCLAGRWCPKPG